jgi:hypothetical protein
MKLHVYRYLYRAGLYVKAVVQMLKERRAGVPARQLPRTEIPAGNSFFLIVVEVRRENDALILLMQTSPSAAADKIQLPEGCHFRTCFEISADYAEVIINM